MSTGIDWHKWIVDICQIHRGLHGCDFYTCATAQEAVMIQKGCNKCSILAPLEEKII